MNKQSHDSNEIDYYFWLVHEVLSINKICLLSKGNSPDPSNIVKYELTHLFRVCPRRSMILAGIKGGEIKVFSDSNASPLECLLYLKRKGFDFPDKLNSLMDNEIESIQKYLNKKIVRNKDSYLRKDTRGDVRVLEAVLRTLLDVYPGYPKDRIIKLLPVQEYANGHQHSEQSLKEIITKIEKGKRSSGNVSNVKELEQKIPKKWLPTSC